jgi:hypothetical protein
MLLRSLIFHRFRGDRDALADTRPTRLAAFAGALLALTWCASCGSSTAYTRGEELPTALPDPEVQVESRPVAGPPEAVPGDVHVAGRLARVHAGPPPGLGFWVEVLGVDRGLTVVTARTFVEGVPDLVSGKEVDVVVSRQDGLRVTISDSAGVAFHLSSGPAVPGDQQRFPIQARGAATRAYSEVLATPDLCRWTLVHEALAFDTGAERWELMPGGSRVVTAMGRSWMVVAVDSRTPDESDCGAEGEPRVAFFWTRVDPAFAKRVQEARRAARP